MSFSRFGSASGLRRAALCTHVQTLGSMADTCSDALLAISASSLRPSLAWRALLSTMLLSPTASKP